MEEQDNKLIELLEQKKAIIKEDVIVLADVIQSLQSIFERYYETNKTFVKKLQQLSGHVSSLIHTKKDSIPMLDRCNTKDIKEDVVAVIDSVIEEVKAIGLPQVEAPKESSGISISNTLNQNQNQSQEVNLAIKILLDAVKDDLTGKQRKELVAIAKEAATPEEAHKGILEKMKEFGSNVSASIVANILTNPQVWEAIGSLV